MWSPIVRKGCEPKIYPNFYFSFHTLVFSFLFSKTLVFFLFFRLKLTVIHPYYITHSKRLFTIWSFLCVRSTFWASQTIFLPHQKSLAFMLRKKEYENWKTKKTIFLIWSYQKETLELLNRISVKEKRTNWSCRISTKFGSRWFICFSCFVNSWDQYQNDLWLHMCQLRMQYPWSLFFHTVLIARNSSNHLPTSGPVIVHECMSGFYFTNYSCPASGYIFVGYYSKGI